MPYIKSNDGRRKALQNADTAQSAGELNYQIFWFIKGSKEIGNVERKWIVQWFVSKFLGKSPNYQRYNDLTGALIRCHREIKRRLDEDVQFLLDILDSYDDEINIYENLKINENGDV